MWAIYVTVVVFLASGGRDVSGYVMDGRYATQAECKAAIAANELDLFRRPLPKNYTFAQATPECQPIGPNSRD